MLKSNKLTSESALTTNRPTSRIDTSYLNRGYSQHSQNQSTNKKLWIKINKVTEDATDTKPYIAIEKQRNTNSCHIRPSINRKTSCEIKNQIDFNEIKHFIKEVDHQYEDEPFTKKANQQQTQQYQNEKRLNHLNLILASFRDRIKSRNISNDIEPNNQQKYNNKIKIRSKQIAIIKQHSDNKIGLKISQLKQQNASQQLIYSNYAKSFRASSDYIVNQIPHQPSQQIQKLTEELGNLENYKQYNDYQSISLTSDRLENSKDFSGRPLASIKWILKRNKKNPDEIDNQLLMDESMISETEGMSIVSIILAKLNSLYEESISIQKNLLQNQKSSPIKAISAIKKMDQIKSIINNVNSNKLMNKFLI
ncbi:unnamed protein product (macronuclear) [Paramecium tetraurelia]|uniref:Uncharacterized protein n=1 Tax=Paramecium tetraurelia TaxID=5888 RepID=A0E7P7_PARTE|nr:uncharacterized protein GSPATT00024042001 [Paramecium tetraurelia]CAK91314.1 unnamed protein product [Paramecium tetraurelia]|eukprot:XP_001458711.1 hypothetical protein (macronuclear) [Paramecium tetraurelia strain d4-2]